jgi:hypothetical protein
MVRGAWELRVFFKPHDSNFDLWQFLGQFKKKGMEGFHPEARSDTYFNLRDKRFGLKLRGNSTLELKVLHQYDTDTTAELWEKPILTPFRKNIKQVLNWKDEIAPILENSSDFKPVIQLLDHFDTKDLIKVDKKRTQILLDTASYNLPIPTKGKCTAGTSLACLTAPNSHFRIEQVDITFRDHKENTDKVYRSICFENGISNENLRAWKEDESEEETDFYFR